MSICIAHPEGAICNFFGVFDWSDLAEAMILEMLVARHESESTAMNGNKLNPEELDERRRRAYFRSWHRGIREMDLLLGGYADSCLATMTDAKLKDFETLLEENDLDLLAWISGREDIPSDKRTKGLLEEIRAIHS